MSPVTFRPSHVQPFARSFAPFVDTFGRAELEVAVALLVAMSVARGDEWRPLRMRDVLLWIKTVLNADCTARIRAWIRVMGQPTDGLTAWRSLLENPFLGPDFRGLAADGWAEFGNDADGAETLRFTRAALDRMLERGWVKPADREPPRCPNCEVTFSDDETGREALWSHACQTGGGGGVET